MTTESQQLRNEWYRRMDFCSPEHNMYHAQTCRLCQRGLTLQFQREAKYLEEIYHLERTDENIT